MSLIYSKRETNKEVEISVITPVFNGEKFIEACLKNVIEQNCFGSVEHIVVDGSSTDKTIEIIQYYSEKYSHIQWISEKDQGQSDAMNKGILKAKGKIIGILNVDDFYEPGVLSDVINLFKSLPEPSLLVGNCIVWNSQELVECINKPYKLTLMDILRGRTHLVNPSAYFYHTSLHKKIGFYKIDEHYAMDVDFVIRAMQVATPKYVDKIMGNYRKHENSKTVLDSVDDRNLKRKRYYLDLYTKQLPVFTRAKVRILRMLGPYWYNTKLILQSFRCK